MHAGRKLAMLTKGEMIELIPLRAIKEARGLFKGAKPTGYRDRSDRI